jgi:hypothetical protein
MRRPVKNSAPRTFVHFFPPGFFPAAAAFIHRTSGEVLFVKPSDPVAAVHFPGKLLAMVKASASWLAIPKHNGPPSELAGFVRECYAGNGFTTEGCC